ncbi:hypothetical protein BGZ83_001872 [Gryganskiella cystojenkinii]|nr:hypothetical protein BGZ83_001872 [Gryganskiella cystojenkinii]
MLPRISSLRSFSLTALPPLQYKHLLLRHLAPSTLNTRLQSSLHPDQSRFIPTTLYEFHGVSARDMLLAEMRYHDVPWEEIAEFFEVRASVEVFVRYIRASSTAHRHGWSPRLTARDIEYYIQQTKASDHL